MPKNGKPKTATLVIVDGKGVTTKLDLAIGKTANNKHYTISPVKDSPAIESYGKLYLKP